MKIYKSMAIFSHVYTIYETWAENNCYRQYKRFFFQTLAYPKRRRCYWQQPIIFWLSNLIGCFFFSQNKISECDQIHSAVWCRFFFFFIKDIWQIHCASLNIFLDALDCSQNGIYCYKLAWGPNDFVLFIYRGEGCSLFEIQVDDISRQERHLPLAAWFVRKAWLQHSLLGNN